MLFRPINKKNTCEDVKRIRYSEIPNQLEEMQSQNNTLIDIAKIKKAKKIIENTEQTLRNRIKAIKKQEEKVIKKRENQFKLFLKLENAKKQHSFYKSVNKTPRKLSTKQNNCRTKQNSPFVTNRRNVLSLKSLHQSNEHVNEAFKAQRLFLQKIQNAKRLKQQKSVNEAKITKRRTVQLSRKLQSAGLIRRNRDKVKQTRQNFYRSRQQSVKHIKSEQLQKEKQQLNKIQRHIKNLQKQEKQALQKWKQIVQDDNIFLFEGMEIKEANRWGNG